MTPDQCVDGTLSTAKTNLLIKQKLFSFSSGDFTIKDTEGKPWYKVQGKVMTIRDKMIIEDLEGNKKVVIQKKMMEVRETFQIYRYTPNCQGQESTETDDGVPIYRFAVVEKDLVALLPKYTYYLYKNNDKGPAIMRGEVQMAVKYTMTLKKGDGSDNLVIGAVGQKTMLQFEGANEYVLEVGEGTDVLGTICFSVAIDQMRQK